MGERTVKPLKYNSLPGLSEKQLAEHHGVLYAGYVKKMNELLQKLQTVDVSTANASYSDLREMKVEETFVENAIRLHEGYFDNMGSDGKCNGKILDHINKFYGSYDNWAKLFMACGIAARGWVVLAWDLELKELRTIVCDVHNQGGVWNCIALLILDVYEHAYFIDYATARKAYIETFMKNIDWKHVNSIIEKYKIG